MQLSSCLDNCKELYFDFIEDFENRKLKIVHCSFVHFVSFVYISNLYFCIGTQSHSVAFLAASIIALKDS